MTESWTTRQIKRVAKLFTTHERKMQTVIIESPYAGDITRNVAYARACMRDCLCKGEAPYASHLLYTQDGVLKDEVPEERKLGIEAGFAWRDIADKTCVYTDCGMSKGMEAGIAHAIEAGHTVEYRSLGEAWNTQVGDTSNRTICPRCFGGKKEMNKDTKEWSTPCPACDGNGTIWLKHGVWT